MNLLREELHSRQQSSGQLEQGGNTQQAEIPLERSSCSLASQWHCQHHVQTVTQCLLHPSVRNNLLV